MIYLDNNATTAVAPEVLTAMNPFLTTFYGNPSSSHTFGRVSRRAVEIAREQAAAALGATSAEEITFTSGGTESTNWAFAAALQMRPHKKRIVTTRVEHEVVTKLSEKLQKRGYEIVWLEVDENGLLDLNAVRAAVNNETALVSVMSANNETGVLFPVAEIGKIVREQSDALFHVDGVQAVGKTSLNLAKTEIDFFAVSGHKFHAPKGVGALYARHNSSPPPFLIGGSQEGKRRAGTENLTALIGLGAAFQLVQNLDFTLEIRSLRDRLENEILQNFPNTRLNGTAEADLRLPNTTNISFAEIEGESILAHLDRHEIFVSTGSACNSDSHQASPVLNAMNIPYRQAMGAIRFSLSRYTTTAEIDFVLKVLPEIIEGLRKISPQAK